MKEKGRKRWRVGNEQNISAEKERGESII